MAVTETKYYWEAPGSTHKYYYTIDDSGNIAYYNNFGVSQNLPDSRMVELAKGTLALWKKENVYTPTKGKNDLRTILVGRGTPKKTNGGLWYIEAKNGNRYFDNGRYYDKTAGEMRNYYLDSQGLAVKGKRPVENSLKQQLSKENSSSVVNQTSTGAYTSTLNIPKEESNGYSFLAVKGAFNADGTLNPANYGKVGEKTTLTNAVKEAYSTPEEEKQITEQINPYAYRQPQAIRSGFQQIAVNPDSGRAVYSGAYSRRQGRSMHNLGTNYVDNLGNEWNMGAMSRADIRMMRRAQNRTDRRLAREITGLYDAYSRMNGNIPGNPTWDEVINLWKNNRENYARQQGQALASQLYPQQLAPVNNLLNNSFNGENTQVELTQTSNTPRYDAYQDWLKNNKGTYYEFYKATTNPEANPNYMSPIQPAEETKTYTYNWNQKYQKGGKMTDEQIQQAFMQFLAQKSGAKNEQELEAYVKQLGEDGLQQAYAEFTQLMLKQTQKAKQGAKLNYIKQLKHQCAEDEELIYYKRGGVVECGCGKKMKKGGDAPIEPKGAERFKAMKKAKGGDIKDIRKQYQNDMKKAKDEAERDSIAANKYNDQEVQTQKPGNYVNGKWVPDRTKSPYNKKKITVSACGSKIKKGEEGFKNTNVLTKIIGENPRKYKYTRTINDYVNKNNGKVLKSDTTYTRLNISYVGLELEKSPSSNDKETWKKKIYNKYKKEYGDK